MSNPRRIPIPWRQRWRRFRQGTLPLVCFLGSIGATLWLWDRQGRVPHAVGEIEAVRVDIVAGTDGVLVPLEGRDLRVFDHVRENEVVARLDDRLARAEAARIRLELDATRKNLEATVVQLEIEARIRQNQAIGDALRLKCDLERYRLDVLDRRAELEVNRVELQRRDQRVRFLEPLYQDKVVSEIEFREEQLLRDLAAQRVREGEQLLGQAETKQEEIEEQLAVLPPLPSDELDALLAPLRQSIDAHVAELAGLKAMIEALELRSPITGTVSAVFRRPGQTVGAADVIMTIASDDAQFVVSYVRQWQNVRPKIGMPVELRMRAPGSRPVVAKVDRVGAQYELLAPPHHQLTDPTRPEWGLPVRIVVPQQTPTGWVPSNLGRLGLRPGELIDVTFLPDSS